MILRAEYLVLALGILTALPATAMLIVPTEHTLASSSPVVGKTSKQTEPAPGYFNSAASGVADHESIEPVARWTAWFRAWLESEKARRLKEAVATFIKEQLAKWKQRHAEEAKKREDELFKSQFGTGGSVLVTGLIRDTEDQCLEKPSLTVAQVTLLARESYGQPDFTPVVPACENGSYAYSWKYGKCCWRSQASYFQNLYDTSVAAMALGATQDEAFAAFLHARALARTLLTCDPTLVKKQVSTFQMQIWETPNLQKPGPEESQEMFYVAFPTSYVILYEIYHTMLIERLRLRRTPTYPSCTAMGQLFSDLGSRRRAAVLDPIDRDNDMLPFLPDSKDMLTMTNATTAEVFHPDVNSTIRLSDFVQKVFELATHRYRTVDAPLCSGNTDGGPPAQFHPFVTNTTVENVFEACCADECSFLSKYGKIFGTAGTNCCRGCNRYSCQSNTRAVADSLSTLSRITTPLKETYSALMFSMIV